MKKRFVIFLVALLFAQALLSGCAKTDRILYSAAWENFAKEAATVSALNKQGPTATQNPPKETPEDIISEEKIALLNSATLSPMKTGCEELDEIIADILSEIITEDMTPAEKVLACYNYVSETSSYRNNRTDLPFLKLYESKYDMSIVSSAYLLATTHVGVCFDYSALFAVLTRALGFESFTAGEVPLTAGDAPGQHCWALMKLGGEYFVFDPVLENLIFLPYGEARATHNFFFFEEFNGENYSTSFPYTSFHCREVTVDTFADFRTYPFLTCKVDIKGKQTETLSWEEKQTSAFVAPENALIADNGIISVTVKPNGGKGKYRCVISGGEISINEIITGEKTYKLKVTGGAEISVNVEDPESPDYEGYQARFRFNAEK